MRGVSLARALHRWLALVIGLQALLWTASGVYMVVVDLDFIHGDPLVRNLDAPVPVAGSWVPLDEIRRSYPGLTALRIRGLPGVPHALYEVEVDGRRSLLDATTGTPLSPLPSEAALKLARAYYAGSGAPRTATLIERDPPMELQDRPLPLWRIDFDDGLDTSFYIDPQTGELVTRRHRFWRWFDFFWMLHIMDYESRENVNNWLARSATMLALGMALGGLWFLYFKLPGRRRARA